MKAFVFLALFSVAIAQQTAFFCEVAIDNFCSGNNAPNCPGTPTVGGGSLAPSRMSGSYAFSQYNIISFKDFHAASDTEGRVAVAGNAYLADGYSIGAEIWTQGPGAPDTHVDYSLIVGGSLQWKSGALYPMASNNFHLAQEEYMFVGGSVDAADYLKSSQKADSQLSSSLGSSFTAAQGYYYNLQTAFAAVPANTDFTVSPNGDFNISCRSSAATSYSVNIYDTEFNRVRTYYFASSCALGVQVVFNILGTGNVKFSGNNIGEDRRAERILFNIIGSGRTITVQGASVRGNILAPYNTLNTIDGGYIQGFQVYGDVANSRQINRVSCLPPAPPVHPPSTTKLCPGFEADCIGLDITLPTATPTPTFSFRDCNVISFKDFNANTGDTEGRVCVARDFNVGKGYSIGDKLSTINNVPDRSTPAALIAGRNCNWASGQLYPAGDNIQSPGAREDAFCGGSFNGSDDLRARNTLGPCKTAGCLDSIFNAAKTCYTGYSTTLAGLSDNVDIRVQWSGLFLTCKDRSASQYVFSITPEIMSQYTYMVTEGCNFQAYWVMNVRGNSDVYLTGDFLAVPNGAAVINVIGSRNVFVTGIKLHAHLLAPLATLNQTGGVIIGKVVAGDVAFSLQINHQNTCPDIETVDVPVVPQPPNYPNTPTIPVTTETPASSSSSSSSGSSSSGSSSSGSSSSSSGSSSSSSSTSGDQPPSSTSTTSNVPVNPDEGCLTVYSRANFQINDKIVFRASGARSGLISDRDTEATIISTTDNAICVYPPSALPPVVYSQVIGYAKISGSSGRRVTANPTTPASSASVAAISFALLAIVALFL